jgi:L-threonylcarbamoyladenylate synthase
MHKLFLIMNTKIISINAKKPEPEKIKKAAKIIKRGGIVAFPTETVYGLGADVLDKKAIDKIFKAKGRPSDNPLIVHIANKEDAEQLVKDVPLNAKKLMDEFWPGPLTLVLKKKPIVPDNVTCGLDTVAIRMPNHAVALDLIKQSGCPIAAPSANISGRPSPTSASHVMQDLKGKIPLVISSGKTDIGLESTVIDMTKKIPVILRPGKITLEEIKKVIGKAEISPSSLKRDITLKKTESPGMKYRHYSPKAQVYLITGEKSRAENKIKELIIFFQKRKKKAACIGFSSYGSDHDFVCKNDKDMAKNLFEEFRNMDLKEMDVIIVEGVKAKGLGLALMNRLRKAATKEIRA